MTTYKQQVRLQKTRTIQNRQESWKRQLSARATKEVKIHPVFHVSLLEPAHSKTPLAMQEELQPEYPEQEYQVEEVLDARNITRGQREYLIKWKGYGNEENSWEPTGLLKCDALVRSFHRKNPNHPSTKT